jgi:predicted signal transduction protein with EAL and GGDEF domain
LSTTVWARLGGDEFAVLMDEIPNSRAATDFAAAIKSAMNPAFDLDGRQVFATCSIGVALGGPDTDANDILRDADIAMYHAKSQGKHRYEVFDAEMRQRAMDRMQLETDLRAAVPRGELDINYQPKISLVDGNIVEFEALVRWNHPVRGFVLPQTFVPLADETGLILPIGEWVLFQACRQLAKWRKRFDRDIGISVNISARQFETAELVSQVRCILAETGIPAASLSLEITESLLLENPESAIRQLNELRAIGIGLKIDDFGTGFSSLSYLHRLPFNELKIDRSFISNFGKKAEATHIVHTIILLGRLLDMKIVAEGVETEDQLNELTALSCDYAQGNFFAKPLPADEAEAFLNPGCLPFFRHVDKSLSELAKIF